MACGKKTRVFLIELAIGLFLTGPVFASPLLAPRTPGHVLLPVADEKKKQKVEHFFKASKIYGLQGQVEEKGKIIREDADTGDAEAQFQLAEVLRRKADQQKLIPSVTDENPLDEAIGWYEAAAAQGHLLAKQRLADLYYHGDEVRPDRRKALRLYREAAAAGDAHSELQMGDAYETGLGVKPNLNQAIAWYERASKRAGAPKPAGEARYRLGKIYAGGGREKANFVRAYMWMDLAAKSGHRDADAARSKIEKQMSLDDIVRAKKEARQWNASIE